MDVDPVPQPQLALLVAVIVNFLQHEGAALSVQSHAISDLIIIAFFYLLQVGEYMTPAHIHQTCTIQFWCKDVCLYGAFTRCFPIQHPSLPFSLLMVQLSTLIAKRMAPRGVSSIILRCLGHCVLSKL